jgi:hypothetical protein
LDWPEALAAVQHVRHPAQVRDGDKSGQSLPVNRPYDSVVLPRVKRFAEKHAGVDTLQKLQDLMGSYSSPFDFSATEPNYKDSRRATTLRGVLSYLLDVEQDFPGSSEQQRLKAWPNWARPGDFAFTGVRGFGLAGFQYLRLLLGANTSKPDVWICRFVCRTVELTKRNAASSLSDGHPATCRRLSLSRQVSGSTATAPFSAFQADAVSALG